MRIFVEVAHHSQTLVTTVVLSAVVAHAESDVVVVAATMEEHAPLVMTDTAIPVLGKLNAR